MKTAEELRRALGAIDHRSYPAYKSLAGSWSFGSYTLNIEHVQGDPFAAPSQLRNCREIICIISDSRSPLLPGFY